MNVSIRPVRPGDEVEITAMVYELAEFENLTHECHMTETRMAEALFGDQPVAHGFLAEVDGQPAGIAVWFVTFSTWEGPGMYLEDLYIRPQFRRLGLARALLSTLARVCVEKGYTRLSWAVLDWNVNAIGLYDSVGGTPLREWITYRVSGPGLSELAGG